jgi:hypothetical protein
VPGQNAEREHLVEHGDPAGTGEIQAPGMTMRPGPGPDTETGSAGARYSSRCADPGFVWDRKRAAATATSRSTRSRSSGGRPDAAAQWRRDEIMKELMGRSLGL